MEAAQGLQLRGVSTAKNTGQNGNDVEAAQGLQLWSVSNDQTDVLQVKSKKTVTWQDGNDLEAGQQIRGVSNDQTNAAIEESQSTPTTSSDGDGLELRVKSEEPVKTTGQDVNDLEAGQRAEDVRMCWIDGCYTFAGLMVAVLLLLYQLKL